MIKSILKYLGLAGKTIKNTIDKSTDFIDDALEKEYITSTIEKAKDLTGEDAEKAGELYEKSKGKAEDLMEDERFKSIAERANVLSKKIEATSAEMVEKGKTIAQEIGNNPKFKSSMERLKETGDHLNHKAEDLMNQLENYISGQESEEE